MFLSTQFVVVIVVAVFSLTILGLVGFCAILCAKDLQHVKHVQQPPVIESIPNMPNIPLSDKEYNEWRRDIAAEYFLRTGRAYPRANTPHGRVLREMLVYMSDHNPKSVMDTVDLLLEIEVLQR